MVLGVVMWIYGLNWSFVFDYVKGSFVVLYDLCFCKCFWIDLCREMIEFFVKRIESSKLKMDYKGYRVFLVYCFG